ncbi:MAG: arylsulfatase [Gammaproteobacteria bacterium]|nr:MAG: arylsulfatase [Gammaproteobacteria bacterium]RLA34262.1 MAG: arylsulfatase [Gammaproteobacteria bacterium]
MNWVDVGQRIHDVTTFDFQPKNTSASKARFRVLQSWAILINLLLLVSAVQAAPQPNILLIYVDDLGFGDLGSYGHPVLQTPNIDALAADGLKLTSYYAPSAICSPSRAALLTGRLPYRTGIKSWIPHDSGIYLRDEEVTLAEVLKAAGYGTAHIGKWHLNSDLGSTSEPQPTDQGFDYFYGHNAFQMPTNHNPVNIFRNKTALPMQEGYTAELYASEAIQWLERRDENKPFFLYLSMAEPHTTIENPPEYNDMYAQYTNAEIVPIPNGSPVPPKALLVPRGPGEYYANITYMDAQLGRVFDWLGQHDLEENTIVVFSSDNGPVTSGWINWWEVNAYGSTGGYRGRKHFLYEGGLRVPTIIRYPNVIEPGSESNAPVIGMDLFVTLANIGGGKVPDDRAIDGIDVQPIFSGGELPQRSLFWALDSVSELQFAIRKGSWKLLLDGEQKPRELYNLAEDPLEFFNLIDEEKEISAQLSSEAAAFLADIASDPLRPK